MSKQLEIPRFPRRLSAAARRLFARPLPGLLLVLLCGLGGLRHNFQELSVRKSGDIVAGDGVDTQIIVDGLQRVQGWPDVVAWWYGPWVAGADYAFYRPLTSTLWYFEYRLFGPQGLIAFQLVHFLSHLAVVVVLLQFLSELFNRRLAVVATICFAISGAFELFKLPGAWHALYLWKDDPEMWFSTAALLSLWAYLRYLRRNQKRDFALALTAFIVGVTIKEMSYIVPLLLPLLLWHEGKLRTHWKSLLPFYATAAALAAFRFWALQGPGFRFGSNGSWKQRWFIHTVAGAPGAQMMMDTYLPLATACAAFALAGLYRALTNRNDQAIGAWRFTGFWVLATAAATAMAQYKWNIAEEPIYLSFFTGLSFWQPAILTLLLLFAYHRFATTRRPSQILAYLWVLISYLPLLTAPITEHALYFVSIGWSLWLAYFFVDIARWVTRKEMKQEG